jgi:hypothetical protein
MMASALKPPAARQQSQRDALGMHELVPVVIDHPLSTLTEEEIDRRAQQATGQCVSVWLGR